MMDALSPFREAHGVAERNFPQNSGLAFLQSVRNPYYIPRWLRSSTYSADLNCY